MVHRGCVKNIILAVVLASAWCLIHAQTENKSSPAGFFETFENPGSEWRGKPFWSWNGQLTEAELIRQINVMKEMGFGGYFMHSRTGLVTEYLGPEWFALTNACADYGQKLGMESWLYDEDRWPSGTAGGLVTQNPAYRMRFMKLVTTSAETFKWNDEIVAAFTCKLDAPAFSDCARIDEDTPKEKLAGKSILVFSIELMKENSFYNGATYVDTMNRDATDAYIKLTHEQYKARCGDRLGASIQGIFTDEPHRGAVMSGFGIDNANATSLIPWTGKLPDAFKKRFGYDIIERLPELFLLKDGQPVSQVKWHYMELCQSLFLENFARPLYDWCDANKMKFTGHVLHEDSLTAQSNMQGSMMRFYECMHYPGVDVLSEGNRNYWIVKQLTSAARQLGQKWLLSELYGCTGWQMRFEDYKYVGNWQALFGINLRCPHLSWYTMGGQAKRDYPASIFYQSGWWKDWAALETYYSRLHVVLGQGQPVCDVAVINPVESVWCRIYSGWAANITSPRDKAIGDIEKKYEQLFHWLAGARIDFDYVDEEMASRLYRIAKEKDGAVLYIGKAPYKAVVVSGMTTIRSTTLKILDEFIAAGGKVVFAGDVPDYVDALKTEKAKAISARASQAAFAKDSIVAALGQTIRPPVEVLDKDGNPIPDVFAQVRQLQDTCYIVLMNMNREKSFENATVIVPTQAPVMELDAMTGRHYRVGQSEIKGSKTVITTDITPIGEKIYIAGPGASNIPAKTQLVAKEQFSCPGPYDYTLGEDNVCVLDMAAYTIDGSAVKDQTEVLKIDQAVRSHFKIEHRGGKMVQPWFKKKFAPQAQVLGKVAMTFEFAVEQMPKGDVVLAMEEPGHFKLSLNGRPLAAQDKGWWVDPAIRKLPVPAALLVVGNNSLVAECDFTEEVNIEAMYLLGCFGVSVNGTNKSLVALPDKLSAGDITRQGLPFYSGDITYRIPIKQELRTIGDNRLFIELTKFDAACVKVNPGNQMIAWQPYRMAIMPDAQKDGFVDLQFVLTRRNTFGPLHQVPLRTGNYGPNNWTTDGKSWSQNYMLWPMGLLEEPLIKVAAQ